MPQTTNQIASAICKALGMPSRFAAEKPPVSPTLRSSLAGYMLQLSDEGLASAAKHGSPLSQELAALEVARRAALNPDTHCQQCHEPLSEFNHCWQCHYPPMDPALDKAPAAPYCNGQCGICSCIPSPQPQASQAK